MESHKGQILGHYHLEELLGQGGFASVYRATDLHLQRTVAIKILSSRIVNPISRQAFLQEARAIARLRHPHIVRVLEYDIADDIPFLVMELAPGGSLRFPSGIMLPVAKIIPYVQQVSAALDYAHKNQFIHRDVKPENMLLGPDGEVLLSDFGLVQIAQSSSKQVTGDWAGTPPYMAPEQARGKPCFASDQYSLGIVVYEWLTGHVPFQGDSPFAVAYQHLDLTPPPLRSRNHDIPAALEKAVLKALEKNPMNRFATTGAFAEAVAQASRLPGSIPALSGNVEDGEAFISTLVKPSPQPPEISDLSEQEEDILFPKIPAQHTPLSSRRKTHIPQPQLVSHEYSFSTQQSSGVDFFPIPLATRDSLGQPLQQQRQDYLRWLILGCAIATTILVCSGLLFQQPQIWAIGIVLAAAGALLGIMQTMQRDQWFWFIGFLCCSPLTGLCYGILHPDKKADPPASMRQLILLTGGTGLLFLASAFVIGFTASSTLGTLGIFLYVSGLDLCLNHWLLAWIRAKRLGESYGFAMSFFFLGLLWYGLACVWDDHRDP
jgi:serine/threonine protein kinase